MPQDWKQELDGLLERLIDGEFNADDRARLNAVLAEGREQRRYYRGYMRLHYGLEWRVGEPQLCCGLSSPAGQCPAVADAPRAADGVPVSAPPLASHVPLVGFFAPSAALLSYVMASLLLGAMIVAGWAWQAPAGRTVSEGAWRWEPAGAQRSPDIIGKITRASACRWHDPKSAAVDGEAVRAGRAFVLVEGSVEITYNTGTRVVLQGPAVYLAASHNGGFLRLGTLTARVTDRKSLEAEADKYPNASARRHALFAVCTPTAEATDNNTERSVFSVAVDATGAAFARVFQGKIVFHVPRCSPFTLAKDYCGMSKTGPNHDGVCIFLNGKEPYQFAAKAPQQPLYSMLPAGENSGVLDRSGQGLKFYPYLEEEREKKGKQELRDPQF